MALHDFRYLDPRSPIDADVCIVGSGPAGWTLAEELGDSGLRVLVLESGGVAESGVAGREAEMQALNATEDIGVPLFNGRCRTLGGTPEMVPWGNRCIAFDDIDYEARPWVPFSGWPFGRETLSPYLDRASRHLGTGPYLAAGPEAPHRAELARPEVDPARLRNVWWSFGLGEKNDTVRYAKLFRQRLRDNVRVIVHATVTHLHTNAAGSRIEAVEVSHPDGHRTTVRARAVVLCAGGIENARILLYSNRARPNGVGNDHDLVGRFLMDHPRDLDMTISLDIRHAAKIQRLFGPYQFDNGSGVREFVGGLALSPEVQRREQLLNTVAWPVMDHADDDPVDAAQRLKRGNRTQLVKDLGLVASHPVAVARGVHSWAVLGQTARPSSYKKIGFYISSEQRPDPESRVTLSDRVDAFGLPIARTDWRISEQDRTSQAVLAKTIQTEFARLRLPEVKVADWVHDGRHAEAKLSDGCHPTGTTRMAIDPREGVVDADCQVHGVDGLYIASSSVFPTAGHANPTLMIVALTVRLAEHLKQRLSNTAGSKPGLEAAAAADEAVLAHYTAARDDPADSAKRLEGLSS